MLTFGPYHSKTVGTVDSDRELIDVLVNSLRCDPPICKTLSVPCRGKSESVHVKYMYIQLHVYYTQITWLILSLFDPSMDMSCPQHSFWMDDVC